MTRTQPALSPCSGPATEVHAACALMLALRRLYTFHAKQISVSSQVGRGTNGTRYQVKFRADCCSSPRLDCRTTKQAANSLPRSALSHQKLLASAAGCQAKVRPASPCERQQPGACGAGEGQHISKHVSPKTRTSSIQDAQPCRLWVASLQPAHLGLPAPCAPPPAWCRRCCWG